MNWDIRPLRVPDLEVSAVTDGFVVSRPGHDRIQFLNPTAALILESCDGALRARELPELLAAAFDLESLPINDVEACLRLLLEEGLVVDQPVRVTHTS